MKILISRWLGYGMLDGDRVMECSERQAMLLGFGQLEDQEAHIFTLRLSLSLGACTEWCGLTATLTWMSPVAVITKK